MTPNEPLRTALIGFGVGGAVFHAPLIAANPRYRLSAVVTSDESKRLQVNAAYPGTVVLASADAVFERARDFDLVVVATPNRTHFQLASSALDAGLPVVVDKPFTPTADEGHLLIEHAHRVGVPLTVFQNRRWDGDMRTVTSLVESGELGTVHRFESRFERWVPAVKPGWREGGTPEEAGGVLYDLGSHLIDQALQLFGPVTSVYAEIDRLRPGVEVEDDVFVAMTHILGVRSHLWMSKLTAQFGPRFRVLGDQAAYTKYGLDPQEAALRAGQRPGEQGWGEESEADWGEIGTGQDLRRLRTEPGAYQNFYDELAEALHLGGAVPVEPADAVAGLDVIAAARRSAVSGKVEYMA